MVTVWIGSYLVSDSDSGILAKKLHGIKWIFLNYKPAIPVASYIGFLFHLILLERKLCGSDNKGSKSICCPGPHASCFDYIGDLKENTDQDQLQLANESNSCRLKQRETWIKSKIRHSGWNWMLRARGYHWKGKIKQARAMLSRTKLCCQEQLGGTGHH